MDKLVAQYTRSRHQNDLYTEQEQRDLTDSLRPLALKFDLPPIANVSPAELYQFKSVCLRTVCVSVDVLLLSVEAERGISIPPHLLLRIGLC